MVLFPSHDRQANPGESKVTVSSHKKTNLPELSKFLKAFILALFNKLVTVAAEPLVCLSKYIMYLIDIVDSVPLSWFFNLKYPLNINLVVCTCLPILCESPVPTAIAFKQFDTITPESVILVEDIVVSRTFVLFPSHDHNAKKIKKKKKNSTIDISQS